MYSCVSRITAIEESQTTETILDSLPEEVPLPDCSGPIFTTPTENQPERVDEDEDDEDILPPSPEPPRYHSLNYDGEISFLHV